MRTLRTKYEKIKNAVKALSEAIKPIPRSECCYDDLEGAVNSLEEALDMLDDAINAFESREV